MANSLDSDYVVKIESINQIGNIDSAILTIGDSFSQQGRFGYQNYLANLFPEYKVYNLGNYSYDYFQELLIGNYQLPPIIILESVERSFIWTLANMDFKLSCISNGSAGQTSQEEPTVASNPYFSFINNKYVAIINYITEVQRYTKLRCNIHNPVKHVKLNRKVFSCKSAENDLYFYQDDLGQANNDAIIKSKKNLETIFQLAKQKGIRFILLVASDKYDLYKPYIQNDPYKVKGNLDYFSEFSDDARFLNSKELLAPYVKSGELDIYKCNDTHWSIHAAMHVAEELKRKIKLQEPSYCN